MTDTNSGVLNSLTLLVFFTLGCLRLFRTEAEPEVARGRLGGGSVLAGLGVGAVSSRGWLVSSPGLEGLGGSALAGSGVVAASSRGCDEGGGAAALWSSLAPTLWSLLPQSFEFLGLLSSKL